MNILDHLYNFVITTSLEYNIDESHALKHSMDVYYYSNRIYMSELSKNKLLKKHKKIIYVSAILHDMCDKKYMNEEIGLQIIKYFMKDKLDQNELDIVIQIISTMSYSTVKKNGYPNLGEYQLAYNIVREADLLASYDFDRCICYRMFKNNDSYSSAFENADNLFITRVLKYIDDNLFETECAKKIAKKMHNEEIKKIKILKDIKF